MWGVSYEWVYWDRSPNAAGMVDLEIGSADLIASAARRRNGATRPLVRERPRLESEAPKVDARFGRCS